MIVMGVDGGGSKTAVRLVDVDDDQSQRILGEGSAGPSNVRAVGLTHAMQNLESAIEQALSELDSNVPEIDRAVLALAGSSRADVHDQVMNWAVNRSFAKCVEVVPDTDSVLALATSADVGVALIVGTGSVATGVGANGQQVLIGGWGHWFGDHGSGYDLGRRALVAIAYAQDSLGEDTALLRCVQQTLGTHDPRDILGVLTRGADVRREIAALAPLIIETASAGDTVAQTIVRRGARESADLVCGAARKLNLGSRFPLGIAGGVICNSAVYQNAVLRALERSGICGEPLSIVQDPVEGAVALACSHKFRMR